MGKRVKHIRRSIDDVQAMLLADYDRLGNWRAVGQAYGISGGYALQVATGQRELTITVLR